MPANLPAPVIYGPAFPDLVLRMESGRQVVDSRSNETLNLTPADFNSEGTFTFGRLLASACRPDHWTQNCTALVVHKANEEDRVPQHLATPPAIRCPSLLRLLQACQTESSKRFMALWIKSQGSAYEDVPTGGSRVDRVDRSLLAAYDFPALIPEVWLNYLGPRKTAADVTHLEENPSRVDFVMFAEGKKCVIEIDGPSHYADYDEARRRYVVSEHRYTKNLRIERSLRRQGWEIFRFANYEVANTPEDEFLSLIADLPGVKQDDWGVW